MAKQRKKREGIYAYNVDTPEEVERRRLKQLEEPIPCDYGHVFADGVIKKREQHPDPFWLGRRASTGFFTLGTGGGTRVIRSTAGLS